MKPLNEYILQFAWKTQALTTSLVTQQGEKVTVFKPGRANTDAGPDFTNAHIKIDDIEWHGSVEIHIKSSDWYIHQHQHDPAYEPVILHVVWEYDKPVQRKDGTAVAVVELKNIVQPHLLANYELLATSLIPIPCTHLYPQVPEAYKLQMKDAALAQRQISKSERIQSFYKATNHDLEETAYRLLARNFGFRLNSEAFERLATILPIKILLKHVDQLVQMEALLFGMAGLLDHAPAEPYTELLQREFNFLGYKYGLLEQKMSIAEWKFLRTRPANFPTLRISQFAKFLQKILPVSSFLTQTAEIDLFRLEIEASLYWQEHYVFGKPSPQAHHELGKSAKENILINSVVPLLFFYATILGDDTLKDKAVNLLESLPSENNAITRVWEPLGEQPASAYDSQALIEQHNSFCSFKKCLECPVGAYLIKKA